MLQIKRLARDESKGKKMSLKVWTKQVNNIAETDVMRNGEHQSAATPQEYLLEKMRDDFSRARKCIDFIDKLRDEKNETKN
jgi:hypothetical protein